MNPGAPTLPVASAATFRPAGGWVELGGGQVVRYTGISGQSLTGIPPTGSGAITTTVIYGSAAVPAPMLVGVTGITVPMLKGAAVHIWIQRDDLLAQAEHAARTGGDGIVEYLISDGRRGVDSLTARCDADLAHVLAPDRHRRLCDPRHQDAQRENDHDRSDVAGGVGNADDPGGHDHAKSIARPACRRASP